LKCPDCDNSLFVSLVLVVDLTLPSQPSSPPIFFYVFSESLPVSTGIDSSATCGKIDVFETPTSAKKIKKIYVHVMSKIIANLVYGLALHEFSVVQSG